MRDERELIHDLANKVTGIAGKTRKLKKLDLEEIQSDLDKMDEYAKEALALIGEFKSLLKEKL